MSRLERIVAALGGDLLDRGRRALISGPGHSAGDRSVSLIETDDGRILIHCFSPRDDWREVRRLLVARGLLDDQARALPARAQGSSPGLVRTAPDGRIARARSVWNGARALHGTIAERYLQRRSIWRPVRSAALRFHPRASNLDDKALRPALVAAIADLTGALQGVQITLLSGNDGAKAAVRVARRIVGKAAHGAVQLDEPGPALILAEGVETALSASAAFDLPAWAALSAGELARFSPPAIVRTLVIAADRDAAGLGAARALYAALSSKLDVEIRTPPGAFADWNDWARAQREMR